MWRTHSGMSVVVTLGCLGSAAAAPQHDDQLFDVYKPDARTQKAPAKSAAPAEYRGLGAESVPAEVVAKFAAPPLPRAVSARIQTMLDIRGAGTGYITAKGDRMYFTSAVTGSSQVWRQDGPMKLPIQLTGGEDRTTLAGLSPDDKRLAVHRDSGGDENYGLYLVDLATGALTTVHHAAKVRTTLQFFADDGASLVYRANDVAPDSYALYRYDIAGKKATRVFSQPGLWRVADEHGSTWLLVKEIGTNQHEVYTYDVATQALAPLLGQNEKEVYDVRFGAAGQVLVRTNKLGDFYRVYRLVKGTLVPITEDVRSEVDKFSIDHARRRIYITHNDRGYERTTVLDARTFKPIPLPKLPALAAAVENMSVGGISRDGRYVELELDGSQLPATTVTLDWNTRKMTAWRVPSTPEVDLKTFAVATIESYPARDGTPIPMLVRRPATCIEPCPVIVNFHGGPESQARPGFSATAQMYVDAGFVYVQPNVRGSSGYGKTWLHADNGPRRLAVITDIEDAARHIRTAWAKNGVAPKIGVMGGSYGGYSTLMAMTYFAGAYDAGVQSVGISSLTTFLMNTAPYRRQLRISEYGDPVADKDALVKLSPITYVDRIRAPLLSIQGVNDPRVPVGEALQIYEALERRGIPGGLILFADEGHGTSRRDNRALSIGHTITFFTKYLK